MEEEVQKYYEVTIQPRLGPGHDDAKEVKVLNRIIRWCDRHIEYEADPRHVEKLLLECGLDGCKPVTTPGVRQTFSELEKEEELPAELHTPFRGAAARGNYLAADRLDAQFALKEICRTMSKPTKQAWMALKRVIRYLSGLPRLIYRFEQQDVDHIDCYTDTDWAGCPRTRKSTSGGCLQLGTCTVKHWSSTQASVTLSSGEAEFNGVVKASGIALGYQSLLRDLGVDVPVRVWTDSSAAMGICSRQGLGKLRHLDTHTLWVQQAVRQKRLDLRKIKGECNPADIFTKHSLTSDKLMSLVSLFSCHFASGRAASAPQLRKHEGAKRTMAGYEDDDDLNEVSQVQRAKWADLGEEEGGPFMPHLVYSPEEMESMHPRLEATDEPYDDEPKDEDDALWAHGRMLAQGIADEMRAYGRTAKAVSMIAELDEIAMEVDQSNSSELNFNDAVNDSHDSHDSQRGQLASNDSQRPQLHSTDNATQQPPQYDAITLDV